ncbi:MAG TPA: hypothetical protein VJB70_02000 [Candidatus Paceibacterota bacterium]
MRIIKVKTKYITTGLVIIISLAVFVYIIGDLVSLKKKIKYPDLITRALVDENDYFAVYLTNPDGISTYDQDGTSVINAGSIGSLTIVDKRQNKEVLIEGEFSAFNTAMGSDESGKFIQLSNGASHSRGISIISLEKKSQIIPIFCSRSGAYFWKDYVVYRDCYDEYMMQWETGLPNIIAKNLETGREKILFKSDGRHYYNIRQIKDDKLFLGEKVVADQSEWSNWDFSTQTKIYDLPSLLSEA